MSDVINAHDLGIAGGYIIEAAMQGDIDQLKAENAKLREERDMYRDLVGMMDHPDLNAQLQAENAKLREYARKLLTGYECGRGELCEGCSWNGWDGDCNARMKARELGVEVES